MLTWLYRLMATDLGHEISRSLQEDEWTSVDGYWLTRADKIVSIWIPNGAFALHLRITERVHGVRFPFPTEVTPSWADRHLISTEVRRHRTPSPAFFKNRRAIAALKSGEAA